MFKIKSKKILTLGLALVMALSLAACGSKDSGDDSKKDDETAKLSGSITAAGSSALVPLVTKASEMFMEENPDVSIVVNAGGSGQGLSQVSDGSIDIGNSDLFAEEKLDEAKAKELVDHQVCTITMAPIVNKDNKVDDLTKQQMIDIFTGKITNWKEVGGDDLAIMLITRPESSGTRALFTTWALDGNAETKGALETDDSGQLRQSVSENKGAIGYLAISYLNGDEAKDIKAVSLDGVEPNLENTYKGKYPVWGFEHMYTKGEAKDPSKAFLDYMVSDDFGKQVEELGYGVMSKMDKDAVKSHTK